MKLVLKYFCLCYQVVLDYLKINLLIFPKPLSLRLKEMIALSSKDIIIWFSSMSILLMTKHGNIHDEERILNQIQRREKERIPSTGKLAFISSHNLHRKIHLFLFWDTEILSNSSNKPRNASNKPRNAFGTSVQLLGFSFFTWRTGMFQDAATQFVIYKSAPWALPRSCLEAETFRTTPPPPDILKTRAFLVISSPGDYSIHSSLTSIDHDGFSPRFEGNHTRKKKERKKEMRETFPLHFTISHLFHRNNYSPRLSVSGKAPAATCEFN